jgi:phosphoserine phosphatase SerB
VKKDLKEFFINHLINKVENMSKFKLTVFDMDGTLLKDKGIFVIAEKKGFKDKLIEILRNNNLEFYKRSIEVAKILKGYNKKEFLEIFRTVPFQDNIKDIIRELRKKNIKTAIATDSYQFLADDLKQRLKIDYAFANNLLTNNGKITGEIEIHNKNLLEDFNGRIYSICKSDVLEQLCNILGITVNQVIAVGDGRVDIGMIKKAGLGIAFNALDEVKSHADIVTNDLEIILRYI